MKINYLPVILILWLAVLSTFVAWNWWQLQSRTSELSSDNLTPADASEWEATAASLSAQIQRLETQWAGTTASVPAITVSSPPQAVQTITQPLPAREYFLPMGYGSTTNRDWTPITGAQVIFDPSKYQPIKRLYLEASGSIISGEVHVLLQDLTHNRDYYEAMLIFNTSSPTWQRSPAIAIPPSKATMQLQILSSNGELANLNDARLVVETGH